MYKTIIFIVNNFQGYIHKYDPVFLSQLAEQRLVILINKKYADSISLQQKKIFSEIYEIDEAENELYHKSLDQNQIERVIVKELSMLSSSKELLLIAHNESCVSLAARIRERFNLLGVMPVLANTLTNKIMMKSKLVGSKIRIPQYLDFNNMNPENPSNCYEYIKDRIGSEFIIKPICSAGSFGVKKIIGSHELADFFVENKEKLQKFYVEEYIDGDLFHCDSIVENNNVSLVLISKYNFPMMEFMNGKNVGSYPYIESPDLTTKLENFNASILNRIGATDGVYHTEIFVEKNTEELVFLESAARAPGGYIIQMYDKSYNVHLLNLELKFKLGLEADRFFTQPKVFSFWAYIPPKLGRVKKIHEPKLKSHYTIKWLIKPGDILLAPSSLKDRVGEIIVWNDNSNELMSDLHYISNNEFIEVEQ